MLSIPKYPEQYAQHFPTIFYLLCCASQHHVLENLPGLHPALGHVSLFKGDWRLPTILQQWAAHMAIYQVSGGHSI